MYFDFDIADRVTINELYLAGSVKEIKVNERGVQYGVRYFVGFIPVEAYFSSAELTLVVPPAPPTGGAK